MEIVKTVLAGCGALALLSVVGCVGLVGVGSYAVDQALDEEYARQDSNNSSPPQRGGRSPSTGSRFAEDPFSDYQGNDESEKDGDWGEQTN